MRSAAVLALLLCAGQVFALPVNNPMTKGDTKVMRCVVEVISDSLSKPSPMPVSLDCLETFQGDERILSILRHQNLLKELQDLAAQGAKERAEQQQQHSSFEDELSEVLENQRSGARPDEAVGEAAAPSRDTVEKREDSEDGRKGGRVPEETRPQAFPEPGQGSPNSQVPGEDKATGTPPPASPSSQESPGGQDMGDSGEDLNAPQGQQTKKAEQQEEEEEAEEKSSPEEEPPTEASSSHPRLGSKEPQKGKGQPEAQAADGTRKAGAMETQPPVGKGEREEFQQQEEEALMAGAPRGPFQGAESRVLERQQQEEEEGEERLSREWQDAKRWSRMDQLAKELTAEKRLEGEDDPDRSMRVSFRARASGFREPGPQLRRGWRPSSQEDSVEAVLPLQARSDPEEKKEEEGSANRRAEDQELESLSAIEAELEKVAHELQALRRG